MSPSDNLEGRSDNPAEQEARAAGQDLADRQQAAFAVCERMFNALLAWATTRDVRYLLAAQRSLTAVQNQQGDTWVRVCGVSEAVRVWGRKDV